MRICELEGCGKKHKGGGLCSSHYYNKIDPVRNKHNPRRYLSRKYKSMRQRVEGRHKSCRKYYEGLPICDRDAFITWGLNSLAFHQIYHNWCAVGFDQKESPSIDRIDSGRGYTFDNMQWVTLSENSRRANKQRRHRRAA